MAVRKDKKLNQSSGLEKIRTHAAGIDLGSTFHVVAVGAHLTKADEKAVRTFPSHTQGLRALVTWLLELKIDTVAMEATGIYWMGLYEALELANIKVCLVNARHLKNVSARKTDVIDAKWIQQLHSYGLLRPSFVPEQIFRDLRGYVRQRENLKQEKSRSMMHIHKAMDMMNLKVHHCLSNMDGSVGMNILRAIVDGQTDPTVLSAYHNKRLKVTKQELQISLEGNYRDPHIFALTQALDRFDFSYKQIQECDYKIEVLLAQMADALETLPHQEFVSRPPNKKSRKNEYAFDLDSYLHELVGVDLTAIDGLRANSVLTIISETGLDLKSCWPTAKHFTSWAQLAPQIKVSGGKKTGHFKVKSVNRVNEAFRLAAFGLANGQSGLSAFYRSIRARKGSPVAIKATARKLAVIFYHMVTKKEEYKKSTQHDFNKKYEAQQIKHLMNKAKKLGYQVQKIA